jgi:hypothetical protein
MATCPKCNHVFKVRNNGKKPTLTDKEWLDSLKENIAYKGMDIDCLFAKMEAWCSTNGKQATRRRFINWLNREEKPMAVTQKKRHFSELWGR